MILNHVLLLINLLLLQQPCGRYFKYEINLRGGRHVIIVIKFISLPLKVTLLLNICLYVLLRFVIIISCNKIRNCTVNFSNLLGWLLAKMAHHEDAAYGAYLSLGNVMD